MNKIKILVVENKKNTVLSFAKELRTKGYKVFTATNKQVALSVVNKNKLDIIFADAHVAGLGSINICKKIKEKNPKAEIVLLSDYGYDVIEQINQFIEGGAREEWLRKPLAKNQLVETVEKILKEKEGKKESS